MKAFTGKLLLIAHALTALAPLAHAAGPAAESYRFSIEFPKYATAHVEARDPSGARWPSFFYGKPANNGTISADPARPAATFTLSCDNRPQKNGDQSRRVLGEIFDTPAKGGVVLQVTALRDVSAPDAKGSTHATFVGALKVGEQSVPFNAPGTLRIHAGGKGDEKNDALMGDFEFTSNASALGLKTFAADAPIQFRATFTAYGPNAGARRKPPLQ